MKTKAFKKTLSIVLTLSMVFGMFAMLGAVAFAADAPTQPSDYLLGKYFSNDWVWYDAVTGHNQLAWKVNGYPEYQSGTGMTYLNNLYLGINTHDLFAGVNADTGVTFSYTYTPQIGDNHRHILSLGQNEYSGSGSNANDHFYISATKSWMGGEIPFVGFRNGNNECINARPADGSPTFAVGNTYSVVVTITKENGVKFNINGTDYDAVYYGSDFNGQKNNIETLLNALSSYQYNYIGVSRWGDGYFTGSIKDLCIYGKGFTKAQLDGAVTYSDAFVSEAKANFDVNALALSNSVFSAVPTHQGDPMTDAYSNYVYAGGTSWSGDGWGDTPWQVGRTSFKVAVPGENVLVYDGVHEVIAPLTLESWSNDTGGQSQIIKYVADNSDLFDLQQNWQGYSSTWNVWAKNNIATAESFSHLRDTDPESPATQRDGASRFWWNTMKYTGSGNTLTYFDADYNISYHAKTAYRNSASTSHEFREGDVTSKANYYVINYAPVYAVLNDAAALYNNSIKDKEWMYTDESLNQAMVALYLIQRSNPNNFTYADARADVRTCASYIKQAVAEYAKINLVKKTGTVTFNCDDGTTYSTITKDYGDTFTVPAVPAKLSDAQYDYIDPVWTPSIAAGSTPVMSDTYAGQTYTASYTPSTRSYQITWNYTTAEGAASTSTTVEYGQTPAAPAAAEAGYQTAERVYTFSNWSPAVAAVTGTAAYTAQYTDAARTYAVKFYDLNGNQIGATQNIAYGAAATAPDLPTKAPDDDNHYTVTWDTAFNNITADTNVTATASGTAHTYSAAPTWGDWTASGDGWTVTATFTCDGCDHTVTPAVSVQTNTYPAGCVDNAATEYSATVTMGGTTYTCPTAKRIETPDSATGHTYVTPAETDWNWTASGDTYTATVVVSCEQNDSTVTLTATVSDPAVVDAQHLTPGSRTFTATATVGSQTFTATKTDEIPAEGHTWTYHEAVPSTVCNATGTVAYWSCSGCDELRAANQTDVITSTDDNTPGPHDYGELVPAVAPTCVDDGNVAYYQCSVCRKYFNESKTEIGSIVAAATNVHNYNVPQSDETYHWLKCANCEAISGKTEHAYTVKGDEVTPARCGVNATANYSCSCGKTKVLEVPETALSHDFSVLKTDDTHHWYGCANEGCEEISGKTEHAYTVKGDEVTPARCGVNATANYSCSCGKTKVLEVPETALSHDFSVLKTDDTHHWYGCANEGCEEISGKTEHAYTVKGDEVTPARCGVNATANYSCSCGKTKVLEVPETALSHDFSVLKTDDTHHWYGCANEGCEEISGKAEHSGGTATCMALAECDVCHQEYGACDYTNHVTTETVTRNAVAAGYTHTGYTGDTYCAACDHPISTGDTTPKLDINENPIYAAAVEVAAEAEADPDKYDATAVTNLNTKLDELTAALAVDNNEEAVTAALGQLETLVEAMAGNILFTLTVDEDNGSAPVEKKGTHGSTVDLGTPEKEGYEFKEWTVTAGSVSGTVYTFTDQNATATAVYTVKTSGAVSGAQNILDNAGDYDDAYVAALTEKLNELSGLDATDPANNAAVKAVVDAINGLLEQADDNRAYTVTFTVDGETVKTEKVKTGNSATPPEQDELKEYDENNHWRFSGWTGDYSNVTANVTVSGAYALEGHGWTDGEVTRPATCKAAGSQAQSCACGATGVKTLPVDPDAHDYGELSREVSATCTSEGVLSHCTCSLCGRNFNAAHEELDSLVIPRLPHTFGDWIADSPANCSQEGTVGHYHCSVCEKDYDAEETLLETVAIPTNDDHDYHLNAEKSKAPGCTEDGYDYYECSRNAEHFYKDTKAHTGHALHHVEAKAAGCPLHAARLAPRRGAAITVTGNDGNIEYWYCDNCDLYFADAEGTAALTEEEIVIPAAHHLTHTEGVAATHTAAGSKEYWYCDICEKYFFTEDAAQPLTEEQFNEQVTIPAASVHTPGEAVKENEVKATCQAGGHYDLVTYCVEGGEELSRETVTTEIDPDAHAPGAAAKENETAATCTAPGSYDWVTRCTLCGDVVSSTAKTVPAKGHQWGEWTVTRPATDDDPGEARRVCAVCGAEETGPAVDVEPVTMTVRFVNIGKMHYIIELDDDETYSIYNSSTVKWTSTGPLTFRVAVYGTFPYPDIIIRADGQELVPDENGLYTLPNNGAEVTVTAAGAVKDDSAPNGKLSFWELLLRFFRRIIAVFTAAFGGKEG